VFAACEETTSMADARRNLIAEAKIVMAHATRLLDVKYPG
jgi:hypothetical protein